MSTDELPKQELLAKMLGMTTSDNDGVALTAIRKANALLAANGWDWARLLAGKITIVEDPFKAVGTHDPFAAMFNGSTAKGDAADDWAPAQPTPRKLAPPFTAPPRPAPRPQPAPPPRLTRLSTKTNIYAGGCYVCGCDVDAQAGWAFKPFVNKWQVACDYCNDHPPKYGLSPTAARRTGQPQGWQTTSNTMNRPTAKNL